MITTTTGLRTRANQLPSVVMNKTGESIDAIQRELSGMGYDLVAVPKALTADVEAMIENGGVVGPTDNASLLDEVLSER